jgi:splicing suppressor protein 51
LEQPITKPFTHLHNGTYLHDRPEIDVYRLLIDSYRMRIEDEHKFEGNASEDNIYGGAQDSLLGFERYLGHAARCPGLLPTWWNTEKQDACKRLGMDPSQGHCLRHAVKKSDIIEHYGDSRFPTQLRLLAQTVIGHRFAWNNETEMEMFRASLEGSGLLLDMSICLALPDVNTANVSKIHS